jgi:hypothetical protein
MYHNKLPLVVLHVGIGLLALNVAIFFIGIAVVAPHPVHIASVRETEHISPNASLSRSDNNISFCF